MPARATQKLSHLAVKNAKTPGYLSDGDGLYLQVSPTGAKSWIFRFRWADKPGEKSRSKEMGLGSLSVLPLPEARRARDAAKAMLAAGINPMAEKRSRRRVTAPAPPPAGVETLRSFGLYMVDVWAPGWKSTRQPGAEPDPRKTDKQKQNWEKTVTGYCAAICDKPLAEIDTEDVLTVLNPLWGKTQEVAHKTRRRLERILAAARVKGLRSGENPARWKDHLEFMLAKPQGKVRHHPAMPYAEVPAFLCELRKRQGRGARALEFNLFTVVRTSEVIFAEKTEIDEGSRIWKIPGDRMKGTAAPDHEVPLVAQALRLAQDAMATTPASHRYIFGEVRHDRAGKVTFDGPLSTATMDKVLQVGLKRPDCTVHGFRSSFRDWVSEKTEYEREVAELSLSHRVGNATELAYWRARMLEKRRVLLHAWADYIDPPKPPSKT